MSITHTFVSAIADGADATLVRPVDWNAAHTGESVDITKATLTEQGDIIYASAASTPAALAHGTSGQALLSGGHAANPSWGAPTGTATIVRKTADETVNNSNIQQNDDHLFFAVAANEVWEFFMLLKLTRVSTSTHAFLFTVPANGTLTFNTAGDIGVLTTPNALITPVDGVNNGTGAVTAATTVKHLILLCLYVGGANAGTVQLQWCQGVAVAENTKVLQNSYLIAHKLT